MKIFLDTEFNGFQGDLISIGMVAEDGCIFYGVRNETQAMDIDPWVQENALYDAIGNLQHYISMDE
jgi:hypothetical protein